MQSRAARTVVIVDDDPQIVALCRLHLEQGGDFEVVGTASTAEEGLQVTTSRRPDAVLIDLGLPDRGGETLMSQLLLQAPEAMVAAFTATDAERAEVRVRATGAFAYYEKDMLDAGLLRSFIEDDLDTFARAVEGEDVVAPSALDRRAAS
jgi:two-component system, NarL family, nitrate/nitrite response regulator NarL